MKISTLGPGVIIFSLGVFLFNLSSGQSMPVESQRLITLQFEDISMIISVVILYMIEKNKFDDMNQANKWIVVLSALSILSVIIISLSYTSSANTSITLDNYLVFLGYILFIIILFLVNIIISKNQPKKQIKEKPEKAQTPTVIKI